jgi:16S rRNA (cytosine1402-N4)-methyltransferase
MLAEALEALEPRPGGRYADGTLGGAGHALAILQASAPDGRLYGCDRDGVAIEAASARLAEHSGRFELRQGTFDDLAVWVRSESCDGALLDLGVSSPQLDWAERGFSFQQEGPLDARMDQRQELTAAQLVNEASADELAKIFWELGGERHSRRMAGAIVNERKHGRFQTTRQLTDLIERIAPRHGRKTHPATRVFQSLRMAVNDELGGLRRGLPAVWSLLKKPGGRLAVITFHSLEDRVVKEFGRDLARDYAVAGPVDVPEFGFINVYGTDSKSKVTIAPKVKGTHTQLGNVNVFESLGEFNAATGDLTAARRRWSTSIALTAVATPLASPPPPIGTRTAARSWSASTISSPTVPWPAMIRSSS